MGFNHIIVSFLVLINKSPFPPEKHSSPHPASPTKKELSPKEQSFSKSDLIRSV